MVGSGQGGESSLEPEKMAAVGVVKRGRPRKLWRTLACGGVVDDGRGNKPRWEMNNDFVEASPE